MQEFIGEAKGADLRCFVVGDQVVASMQRQAPEGDFRSNLHAGGTAVAAKASRAEQQVAVRSAKALGLSVCGVDLICPRAARWCWRSTPRRGWRASKRPAVWTWPHASSNT